MLRYRTIVKEAAAEQIIERSRFIGHACPVESREEADAFFSRIRASHKTATHNVPAFVLGEQFNLQWASDDGEPQGTSGAPMVQMLVKEGLTNLAIMVTRYFGGIKLGTGGLVRAYTGSAKLAVMEAGVCSVLEQDVLTVKLDYSYYGKVQNMAEDGQFVIHRTGFEDVVILDLASQPEDTEKVRAALANLTGGQCRIEGCRRELVKVPEA